jgi:hypothetical protein
VSPIRQSQPAHNHHPTYLPSTPFDRPLPLGALQPRPRLHRPPPDSVLGQRRLCTVGRTARQRSGYRMGWAVVRLGRVSSGWFTCSCSRVPEGGWQSEGGRSGDLASTLATNRLERSNVTTTDTHPSNPSTVLPLPIPPTSRQHFG